MATTKKPAVSKTPNEDAARAKSEPKDTGAAAVVAHLEKKGYKVSTWDEKDRDLVFFRAEKGELVRQLAFSQQAVDGDTFPQDLEAIINN